MPKVATSEEIASAYMQGWKLGLKAVAIYRDGSKMLQPVQTKKHNEKGKSASDTPPAKPFRRRLPDTRHSITHKFSVAGHEGYLTVGLYEDNQPGELFITMAKEGSTVGGLMDVIGTCTSMALQYGVPLITLVDKFRHARFEPAGMTSNRDIPFAKSLIDYIFCWMGCQFITGYAEHNTPNRNVVPAENKNITTARQVVEKTRDLAQKIAEVKATAAGKAEGEAANTGGEGKGGVKMGKPAKTDEGEGEGSIKIARIVDLPNKPINRLIALANERAGTLIAASVPEKIDGEAKSEAELMQQFNAQFQHFQDDAPACDICGSITVRNGTCYKCFNCGNSMGCS
jgi:ribonucleoside-diphosphate reductase alpha chain